MQAYAELLEEEDIRIPAWFSFTSKDGINAASGDPIMDCAAVADSCDRVAAVGVNCTAPRFIHGLIHSIKKVHLAHCRPCFSSSHSAWNLPGLKP